MHYTNYTDLISIALKAKIDRELIVAADVSVVHFTHFVQDAVTDVPGIGEQPVGQSIDTLASWLVDSASVFKPPYPTLASELQTNVAHDSDGLSILHTVALHLSGDEAAERFEPVEQALTNLGQAIATYFSCQCTGSAIDELAFGGILLNFSPESDDQPIPSELAMSDASSDWWIASGVGV